MMRLILKHSLLGLMVVIGAVTLTFLLARFNGDPTSLILPQDATEEQHQQLRHNLGLDRPVLHQYVQYVRQALGGDLGSSYFDSSSVSSTVLHYLPNTVILATAAFACTLLVAIPLGTFAAIRRDGMVDRIILAVGVVGNSIPSFWSALLLIQIFAVGLGWFPTYGASSGLKSLILPTMNLVLFMFPAMSRLTRSSVLQVLPAPYISTARSKGLSETRIVLVHVLRNALVPVLALAGLQLGNLFGGAVLTETVFAWPGIGTLAVHAISRNDFPIVQGIVVYVAVIFAVVTLLVEVLIRFIDPRLR